MRSTVTTKAIRLTQQDLLMISMNLCILWASAQIKIPWQPVPFTLQSAVVLWIGATQTPLIARCSILSYLSAGLLGLPVFANYPANPLYLWGPTAGYLWGFAACIWLQGHLNKHFGPQKAWQWLAQISCGHGTINLCGFLWLCCTTGSPETAWRYGINPFLLSDLLKVLCIWTLILPAKHSPYNSTSTESSKHNRPNISPQSDK